MPTIKQTLARRANAKQSRGPKTVQGKAASSRNALKFGFFSRDPVIPGEDPAEWQEFRRNLLASLAPVGGAQQILADRIVDSAWRLRRFPVVEAGIFTACLYEEENALATLAADRKSDAEDEAADLEELEPDEIEELDERDQELADLAAQAEEASEAPETAMGRAFIRDSQGTTAFLKLGRYETGIERALCRNLQALERLQAVRGKGVHKELASAKKVKLQNDLTEGLTVTDRAA
jgi:hypothetical protein